MIRFRNQDGGHLHVNPDYILHIEPDSSAYSYNGAVIHMTGGARLRVSESPDEVMKKIRQDQDRASRQKTND